MRFSPRSFVLPALALCSLRCAGDQSPEPETSTTSSALSYPANMVLPLEGQVGPMPGSGSVSADGSYHYQLPIEVPPGRRGMAPKLSLSYSSRGTNGLLGIGWELGGMSPVRQCAATIAYDGIARAQESGYDYCYDGRHLLRATDGTYRFEDENSTQITVSNGNTIITFALKDGTRRVFTNQFGGVTLNTWELVQEIDADGNSSDYMYDVVSAGEVYPDTITYTNRSGEPGKRTIKFGYGRVARKDPVISFRRGVQYSINKLLTTIECDAPNPSVVGAVSTYTLTYSQSPGTGQSRLVAVDHTGADGNPQAERTFNWQSSGFVDYDPTDTGFSAMTLTSVIPGVGDTYRTADLDGNGQDELLEQSGDLLGVKVIYASQYGGFLDSTFNIDDANFSFHDAAFGDFDGNGTTELIAPWFPDPNQPVSSYKLIQWSGAFPSGSFTTSSDFGDYHFENQYGVLADDPGAVNVMGVADLDGDGLLDLIQGTHDDHKEPGWEGNEPYYPEYFNYKWTYRHNSTQPGMAASFDDPVDVPFSLTTPVSPWGTPPVHAPLAGGGHPTFAVAAGGGRQALYFADTWDHQADNVQPCLQESYEGVELDPTTGALVPVARPTHPQSAYADVNGDGEADLVHYDVSSHQMCVWFGGAPSGTPSVCVGIPVSETETTTIPEVDTCTPHTPAETVGPWHLVVYDMDADGRDDVALVHDDDIDYDIVTPESYRVWFDATGKLNEIRMQRGPLAVGDFDGDGRLDAAIMASDGEHLATVRVKQPTQDILTGVGDKSNSSTNTRESIGYSQYWAPLTTTWPNSFWARPLGSPSTTPLNYCTFPVHCGRSGMQVVTYHSVTTGDDPSAQDYTYYRYSDPRIDSWGRGFLGFSYVDAWDPVAMHETVTRYDVLGDLWHVVPIIQWAMTPIANEVMPPPGIGPTGLPTYNPGATPRSRVAQTTYIYDDCGGTDASEAEPNCMSAVRTDEWEENLTYANNTAGTFPQLNGPNGWPTSSDPGATLLRTRMASYLHDHYGNVTYEMDWTVGGKLATTTTTYQDPDLTNWLVARPKSVVTTLGCGDSACTSTSDGTLSPTPRRTDFAFTGADLTQIEIEPTSSDPAIQETIAFARNSDGSVTSVTHSAPGQTSRTDSYAYDTSERMFVTSHTNPLSQTEQFLYHPGFGALVSTSGVDGVVTSFQIDELGHRRSVIPSGAATTKYSFLPRLLGSQLSGTIATVTSTDGSSRNMQTDLVGHVVSDSHVGFAGVSTMQVFGYDAEGRRISTSRPGWGTPGAADSTELYDTLDRPYTHTDAAGGMTTYVQAFATTQITDPANHVTLITRDVDDRTLSSTQYLAGSYPLVTSYHYGNFDQLARTIDPNSNTIASTYDQRGRRLSVTSPDSGTSSSAYDAFDNVTATAEGTSTTTFTRDLLGRPTQIVNADGTAYLYWDGTNGIGKPSSQESPDGTYHAFYYDTYGRDREDIYLAGGQLVAFQRTFDSSGRVSSLVYPSIYGTSTGLTVGYTYNSRGYLSSIGRTDSGSTTVYWQAQSETVDDVPDSIVLGNGITGNRYFDPAGRLSEIKDTGLTDLKYTYNAESALASQTDVVLGRTDTYTYDDLHRLTQWKAVPTGASTRTMNFAYDNLGNLLSEKLGSSTVATYTYGASGAGPHAPTYASTIGTITYDTRGRQLSTPTRRVTYTEHDLPKTVTIGSDTTTFSYDVDGARVFKQDSAGWTMSVGGLWERRSSAGVLTDYYYVRGPEGAIVQTTLNESTLGRGVSYISHDVRGTPLATSNGSGGLVRRFFFDPWGHRTDQNAVPVTGTDATMLYGLDELRYDDELGLVDQRGRSYDPSLRHFLSADPAIGDALDSQTYNRYSYIYNDPVNRTDPSGFDPEDGDFDGGFDGGDFDPPDAGDGYGFGSSPSGDQTAGASPAAGGGGTAYVAPPPPPNMFADMPHMTAAPVSVSPCPVGSALVSKAKLIQIAVDAGVVPGDASSREGQFILGRSFEMFALTSMGQSPNGTPFWSPELNRYVIPDAIGDYLFHEIHIYKDMWGAGVIDTPVLIPDSATYEVKATGRTLGLGYQNGQLQGIINTATLTPGGKLAGMIVPVIFAMPSDGGLTQSLLDHATAEHVSVWISRLCEYPTDGHSVPLLVMSPPQLQNPRVFAGSRTLPVLDVPTYTRGYLPPVVGPVYVPPDYEVP